MEALGNFLVPYPVQENQMVTGDGRRGVTLPFGHFPDKGRAIGGPALEQSCFIDNGVVIWAKKGWPIMADRIRGQVRGGLGDARPVEISATYW